MAGHVTELVAVSWIEKPCGRSSRSTMRRMPPGLPSRTTGAGLCAAAGTRRQAGENQDEREDTRGVGHEGVS